MRSADDGATRARLPAGPVQRALAGLCAGVLALLCGLILAAGAHAAEPAAEHEAAAEQAPASGSQGASSEPVSSGGGAPGPTEQETVGVPPGGGEGTKETSTTGTGTGTGVTAGEQTETTPVEKVVEPPVKEPPPAEQIVQPPAKEPEPPPAEQVVQPPAKEPEPPQAPPVEVHTPETPVTHETPVLEHGEHGTEATTTLTEQGGGATQSGAEQRAVGVPLNGGPTGGSPSAGAQASAIAPIATLTSAQSEGASEPPLLLGAGGSAARTAAKSAAFGSGPLGCALLGTNMSGVCPESRSARPLLTASPLDTVASAASLTATTTGVRGAEAHGHTAVMTPPASPIPGPQPSGASGAGSTGAGGGLALSGFLSHPGLLLLAAPRATRRLRLHCRPWRAACFALIPERPG